MSRQRAASTLDGRTLPPIYGEAYAALCPNDENRISGEVFVLLMKGSGVDRQQLKGIWDSVHHTKTGSLDRDQFNHALAFAALVQAGEEPNDARLEMWPEAPTPKLVDVARFEQFGGQASKLLMDYTYRELEDEEYVQITVEDKKGGMLKKYTNYSVFSKRKNVTVLRRYSEFALLDELLRRRYTNRIIAAFPAKEAGMARASFSSPTPEFIEARRSQLARWLTSIMRHPIMRDDELITIFFGDADVKVSLNAAGKTLKTELQLSTIKDEPLRFLPSDAVASLQAMPIELDAMLAGFGSLVALADKAIARKKEEVDDWAVYSADIGKLAALPASSLAGQEQWGVIHVSFKHISEKVMDIHESAQGQILREDSTGDRMRLWLQMLQAYRELFNSRMQKIEADLARLKSKIVKNASAAAKAQDGTELSAKLGARLERRTTKAELLEMENDFCLYCLWMEGKLLRSNFAQVGAMFEELASCNVLGKKELAAAWANLEPVAQKLSEQLDVSSPFR